MAPGPDSSVRGLEGTCRESLGKAALQGRVSAQMRVLMGLSTVSWGEGSSGRCTGPRAGVARHSGWDPLRPGSWKGARSGQEKRGRAGHAGPCNAGEQVRTDSRGGRKLLEAFKA